MPSTAHTSVLADHWTSSNDGSPASVAETIWGILEPQNGREPGNDQEPGQETAITIKTEEPATSRICCRAHNYTGQSYKSINI